VDVRRLTKDELLRSHEGLSELVATLQAQLLQRSSTGAKGSSSSSNNNNNRSSSDENNNKGGSGRKDRQTKHRKRKDT